MAKPQLPGLAILGFWGFLLEFLKCPPLVKFAVPVGTVSSLEIAELVETLAYSGLSRFLRWRKSKFTCKYASTSAHQTLVGRT